MVRNMKALVVLLAVTAVTGFAFAGKAAKAQPQGVPAPEIAKEGFLTDAQINKLAEVSFKAEAKRRPSSSARVATEPMLSDGFVTFRDRIIAAKSGEQFYSILKEYDNKYDSIPASQTDLKFTVARMASWLPFRGISWRMTPMVHKIVVTQQVLLGSLRNIAEQGMINFPDSHIEAQMLFLTMPMVDVNAKGVMTLGKRFNTEYDFIKFLGTDVRQALRKSVMRIEAIEKMANVDFKGKGNETPVVFDARLRFGATAFGDAYDAADRFKVMGEAERYATLARLHRRLSAIASMTAYNWNGHLETRKQIGHEFGIGVAESALFGVLGTEGAEYVSGADREKRTSILKNQKALYTLTNTGANWMKVSYFHLHKSVVYLDKTWEAVKKEDMDYIGQLDPEVLMGRREQIEMGLVNLKKIAGKCSNDLGAMSCDAGISGADTLVGAISGEKLNINLKAFYENPPQDLKSLLPIKFSKNEELDPLKATNPYKSMKPVSGSRPDVLSMTVGNQTTTFRNYLYGRATGWDSTAYGVVFPGVSSEGVAKAMSVINETRGARIMNNAFSMFIR